MERVVDCDVLIFVIFWLGGWALRWGVLEVVVDAVARGRGRGG